MKEIPLLIAKGLEHLRILIYMKLNKLIRSKTIKKLREKRQKVPYTQALKVTPVNWYISSFQQEAGLVYASIFMQRQQGDIDFDTYKTTFAHVELLQKFRSQSTATHVQACRHQSTNPLLYKR